MLQDNMSIPPSDPNRYETFGDEERFDYAELDISSSSGRHVREGQAPDCEAHFENTYAEHHTHPVNSPVHLTGSDTDHNKGNGREAPDSQVHFENTYGGGSGTQEVLQAQGTEKAKRGEVNVIDRDESEAVGTGTELADESGAAGKEIVSDSATEHIEEVGDQSEAVGNETVPDIATEHVEEVGDQSEAVGNETVPAIPTEHVEEVGDQSEAVGQGTASGSTTQQVEEVDPNIGGAIKRHPVPRRKSRQRRSNKGENHSQSAQV